MKGNGDLIEIYRGEKIFKYPIVPIRISIPEAKRVIDAKKDCGMSAREAIESKIILCPQCTEPKIIKYNPHL